MTADSFHREIRFSYKDDFLSDFSIFSSAHVCVFPHLDDDFFILFFFLLQENLQTLGTEIERLIKQQRDPEDGARRKWHEEPLEDSEAVTYFPDIWRNINRHEWKGSGAFGALKFLPVWRESPICSFSVRSLRRCLPSPSAPLVVKSFVTFYLCKFCLEKSDFASKFILLKRQKKKMVPACLSIRQKSQMYSWRTAALVKLLHVFFCFFFSAKHLWMLFPQQTLLSAGHRCLTSGQKQNAIRQEVNSWE